jgi:hypothetical protein
MTDPPNTGIESEQLKKSTFVRFSASDVLAIVKLQTQDLRFNEAIAPVGELNYVQLTQVGEIILNSPGNH